MLQSTEGIDTDLAIRVSFGGYGDSTIDIAILAYSKTTDIGEFTAMRQEVMLNVGRIVAKRGADFAFPTMTIDMPPQAQ